MTDADTIAIEESTPGGSGGPSLAGYEYQIDVSVWLGLELVLVTKLANELTLEPASQEDIEAELQDAEPGRVTTRVPLAGYILNVQAKRRGGDAWTVNGIKSLLQHGGEKRVSAAKRLEDPAARYLLVTSAGLNGGTRNLKVRRAGNWPKADALPRSLANALPKGAGGRVAVIGDEDDERLEIDINRLLTEGCRVPNAKLAACRKKLREEARARIGGAGGGRWTREDLEGVIRDHEGYLASSPELENYVHPINWSDLRDMMATRHAALIIGQSGTGKTLATRMLHDELRNEMPGLSRIPVRLGPQEVRDDTTDPPVLFDIEDPWGRFDFDPRSRPWNDQLAQILANASADRMVIATTREDVALSAGALDSVKPWLVPLQAEHYGQKERIRLYQSRIDGLPRELRPVARNAIRNVLDELATPLEIQKFFDAMRTQDREDLKNEAMFVSEAIRKAHKDSIEQTVFDQIQERGDVRAAAVVWALLKASDKLSRTLLRDIEDGLADRDAEMERGVSPLVDFFVAARNLRQSDAGIATYYHPRVEAGIERSLDANRQVVRRTLTRLIELLVSADGPGEEWGAGTAARILESARERFGIKLSAEAETKIDSWIDRLLTDGGGGKLDNLRLAAAAGSPSSNGAEVARFLLHRADRSFEAFSHWTPPEKPDAWYAERQAHPATRPIVEAFIKEVLPTDRVDYSSKLASHLERLAPNLSGAFLEAAGRAVHFGYIPSDDAIVEGALADLDAFEAIVDAAVVEMTPTPEQRESAAEVHLEIVNDVYSDDYAEHLADNDDGYTAGEFLKAYVGRVRRVRGWESIAAHRHRGMLLSYWTRALSDEAESRAPDGAEFASAFEFGYGSDGEQYLWTVLRRAWDPAFLPALLSRIAEGHPDRWTEGEALACILEHAPDALTNVTERLMTDGNGNRIAELAIQLSRLRKRRGHDGNNQFEAADAAVAALPAPFAEIGEAAMAIATEEGPALSEVARGALAAIDAPSERVRRLRLDLDVFAALPIEDDIRWMLDHSQDSGNATAAVEAAVRHNLVDVIGQALDHRFAHAGAKALTAYGEGIDAPLPVRLLEKASDRASPIRKALVALLKAKPHRDHIPTLLHLAKDRWSRHSSHYGDDDDFPIAQAAVSALSDLAPLAEDETDQLLATGIESSDSDVRRPIFNLVARTGTLGHRNLLFELAIQPGGAAVRRAAAAALLHAAEQLEPEIVARITPQLLATRYAPVAAVLAILLGWRADTAAVEAAAQALFPNAKRRVLILLLIRLVTERDPSIGEALAAMLPAGHPAVAWALGGELAEANDALIADLGDPEICAQVLIFMKPTA